MNGTQGAIESSVLQLDGQVGLGAEHRAGGSAARTDAMSALIWLLVAALEKRYSIWLAPGVPGARSAATSDGSTQAWAVWVIEVAKPTMVRCGDPDTPVTVIWAPICSPGPCYVAQHHLAGLRRPVTGFQREVVHRADR